MVCLLCFLLARFCSNKGFVLENQLGFGLVTPDSHRERQAEQKLCFSYAFHTEFFPVLLCSLSVYVPHLQQVGLFGLWEKYDWSDEPHLSH